MTLRFHLHFDACAELPIIDLISFLHFLIAPFAVYVLLFHLILSFFILHFISFHFISFRCLHFFISLPLVSSFSSSFDFRERSERVSDIY